MLADCRVPEYRAVLSSRQEAAAKAPRRRRMLMVHTCMERRTRTMKFRKSCLALLVLCLAGIPSAFGSDEWEW